VQILQTFGLLLVIVIQIVGPLSVLVAAQESLNFDLEAWKSYTRSQWATVILSWCFLFCFILNAYYSLDSDEKTSAMCDRIARALLYVGEPVAPIWLWLDVAVNCFVAVGCSMGMYALLMNEESPKDVMMDALGLVFLLRIDDVAGEIGFLGGVWDSRRVGQLYDQLRSAKIFDRCGCSDPRDLPPPEEDASSEAEGDEAIAAGGPLRRPGAVEAELLRRVQQVPRQVPRLLFLIAKGILLMLLFLALPSPFLFASKATSQPEL